MLKNGKGFQKLKSVKLRKHHKWLGKQRFFCRGRIFAGPRPIFFVMTFTVLNTLGGLGLCTYFNDLFALGFTYLFWLHAGLLFTTNLLMTACALSDPGTIPMRKFLYTTGNDPLDNLKEFISCKPNWLVLHNGRLSRLKICFECQILRPPRTVHCDDCGTCIQRLDHHCPWVNNCIGLRNYKYFLVFINALCLLILSTIVGGIVNLYLQSQIISDMDVERRLIWRRTLRAYPVSFVIPFLALCCGMFPIFLSGYHHYLICANLTTNEQCKNSYTQYRSRSRKSYCRYLCHLFRVKKALWNPNDRLISLELDSYRLRESVASARSLARKDSDASGVPQDSQDRPEELEFEDQTSRENYPSARQSARSSLPNILINRPAPPLSNNSLTFEQTGSQWMQSQKEVSIDNGNGDRMYHPVTIELESHRSQAEAPTEMTKSHKQRVPPLKLQTALNQSPINKPQSGVLKFFP